MRKFDSYCCPYCGQRNHKAAIRAKINDFIYRTVRKCHKCSKCKKRGVYDKNESKWLCHSCWCVVTDLPF